MDGRIDSGVKNRSFSTVYQSPKVRNHFEKKCKHNFYG